MMGWKTCLPALMVIAVMGLLAGCSSDDNSTTGPGGIQTEQEMLVAYMEANGLDLPTMMASWIVAPDVVFDAGVDNYFIIDIRTGDQYGPGTSGSNGVVDFEDGHIEGAHMANLDDVVTFEAANNTNNDPVLVVCYTGQAAGHAVMALRLSGVSAKVLKWGMSGWNSDFDLWSGNCTDTANDYPGAWLTEGAPPADPSNTGVPAITTGLSEGGAILDAQIAAMLTGGYSGIGSATVLGSPGNYHVLNYWELDDWNQYGHIDGAYLVESGTLALSTLGLLDADGTNVTYCWTGQTASMVTAWLTVLGYNAKGISFSANAMIHSDLQEHKWVEGTTPMEYEYESSTQVDEFSVLTTYLKDNDLDLPDMMASWLVDSQTLYEAGLENYFIIDIRTDDKYGPGTSGPNTVVDYVDGHIPGALMASFEDVVTFEAANNTGDLPVIVVCYTGHNAAHAVVALRLMGVDAQVLKWGMSGWNSDFDLWSQNTDNTALDYPSAWAETAAPELPSFSGTPTITTGGTTGETILASQVNNLLSGGLRGITNTTVLADYDNYHVICYWEVEYWDTYGHITDAYQVEPGTIGVDTLDLLDPTGSNVIYCWTGQTASMLAAWMTVVGYDAKTLKFSANGMIYDDLSGHKFVTGTTPAELDYDSGDIG